jgi:hypothetical protein
MKFEVVDVTPDMARDWLATNIVNRPVSRIAVAKYASDMRSGRWRLTKEAISFDTDGRLDDGRHRLFAVIDADTAVTFTVITDAPIDQFEVLDSGRARNLGQILAMEGQPNPFNVAAAARTVLRYRLYPDVVWTGTTIVTAMQCKEYLIRHPIASDGLTTIRRRRVLTPTAWLALQHVVATMSPHADMWDEFSDGVLTGAGLDIGDPRLAVANWQGQRWGDGQGVFMAGLLAWNHWVDGTKIKHLRSRRDQLPMPKAR